MAVGRRSSTAGWVDRCSVEPASQRRWSRAEDRSSSAAVLHIEAVARLGWLRSMAGRSYMLCFMVSLDRSHEFESKAYGGPGTQPVPRYGA